MVGATVGEVEPVLGDGKLKFPSSLLAAGFLVIGAST